MKGASGPLSFGPSVTNHTNDTDLTTSDEKGTPMSPEEIEAERLDEIAAGLLDAHIEDEELHEMEVSCPYN